MLGNHHWGFFLSKIWVYTRFYHPGYPDFTQQFFRAKICPILFPPYLHVYDIEDYRISLTFNHKLGNPLKIGMTFRKRIVATALKEILGLEKPLIHAHTHTIQSVTIIIGP